MRPALNGTRRCGQRSRIATSSPPRRAIIQRSPSRRTPSGVPSGTSDSRATGCQHLRRAGWVLPSVTSTAAIVWTLRGLGFRSVNGRSKGNLVTVVPTGPAATTGRLALEVGLGEGQSGHPHSRYEEVGVTEIAVSRPAPVYGGPPPSGGRVELDAAVRAFVECPGQIRPRHEADHMPGLRGHVLHHLCGRDCPS